MTDKKTAISTIARAYDALHSRLRSNNMLYYERYNIYRFAFTNELQRQSTIDVAYMSSMDTVTNIVTDVSRVKALADLYERKGRSILDNTLRFVNATDNERRVFEEQVTKLEETLKTVEGGTAIMLGVDAMGREWTEEHYDELVSP
jgi:hypothetical protein